MRVFSEQRAALAEFNLEKPLRVLVGASVTKASSGKSEEEETVAEEDEGFPGNQRRAEKIIPMNVVQNFGKKLMILAKRGMAAAKCWFS